MPFIRKLKNLTNGILPPGVKVIAMLDRSDLLRFTLNTVMRNLTEGMILVSVILFLFLLNGRAALIVALTIPFSLLFASILLDVSKIPANLLSLGALDFGMVVDGTVVMVENIIRHLSHRKVSQTPAQAIRDACHEVQRPVFYAIAIIITAYMPIFTLQRVEGRLFRPMAWTVAFALLGAMTFSILIAPVLASTFFRGVSVPLPIFNRNQGEIARTHVVITQAQRQQEAARGQALTEVKDAYEALMESDRVTQYFRSTYLEVSQKSRDISEYAYRRGAAPLLDFLDAERSYRAIQLAYRQAIAAYLTALEQLREAVGTRSLP